MGRKEGSWVEEREVGGREGSWMEEREVGWKRGKLGGLRGGKEAK